jgi:hypothetical protein
MKKMWNVYKGWWGGGKRRYFEVLSMDHEDLKSTSCREVKGGLNWHTITSNGALVMAT